MTLHSVASFSDFPGVFKPEKPITQEETDMKKIAFGVIPMIVVLFFAGIALAQDPIFFPAKGQSQEQMEKDKLSCYQWARNETGFDPMQAPTASTPPPQQQARSGGALRGAAAGAGVGALVKRSGSRSKGAATGAVVGGVLGGARQARQTRQDDKASQQWEQQQANEYAQKRNTYNRALSACMESKGYTVK
jgi:hypothetical protein